MGSTNAVNNTNISQPSLELELQNENFLIFVALKIAELSAPCQIAKVSTRLGQ